MANLMSARTAQPTALTRGKAAEILVEKYGARVEWNKKDGEWFFRVAYSYEDTGPDLGEALFSLNLQEMSVEYARPSNTR